MPTSRLFPPLPKELPVVDFACIRKRSFQDDSSDLSDLPDSPTSSETIRTTRSTRHRSKRIRIQGPTPSSTKSGDHHSPLYETPDETSFALPQVAIDALCATINETFPWASFAAEHNLDPTTLRTHINQQILFPILSTSSPSSPYHELVARAENYRIVRRAIAARLTTAELDEARELRDYEKMRDKERWQARKQEFRAELE
ncbi:MAG: hypothetical protein LQ350_005811, partial [Teloschistes chrysophthalmus]